MQKCYGHNRSCLRLLLVGSNKIKMYFVQLVNETVSVNGFVL